MQGCINEQILGEGDGSVVSSRRALDVVIALVLDECKGFVEEAERLIG